MLLLFYIFIGGGLGAISRYGVSRYLSQFVPIIFPWGTMAVNLIGCFLLGFFYESFSSVIVSNNIKSTITIGFLGAFTTFSTFSLETINLFKDNEIKLGVANILINNLLGIIFIVLGIFLSRLLLKAIR